MTPAAEAATSAEATTAEATNLESTLSDIDKVLLDLAAEEAAAAIEGVLAAEETAAVIEEAMAAVPRKGKEIAKDTSKDQGFCFQNLIGQELSKAEKEKLSPVATSQEPCSLAELTKKP
jgi:methanogenic corrinoid protein MtbC1